ncbi:unnamed protein product, partial [Ectocarpus sp. 8 AP-2014]
IDRCGEAAEHCSVTIRRRRLVRGGRGAFASSQHCRRHQPASRRRQKHGQEQAQAAVQHRMTAVIRSSPAPIVTQTQPASMVGRVYVRLGTSSVFCGSAQ